MKTKDFTGIKNNTSLPDPQQIHVPSDIDDLRDEYVESTGSMLDDLEQATLAYESGASRDETAATIRRILHKLKGEASMVGIDDISELCHQTEFAFEELPEKHRPDMLLRFKDWMCAAIDYLRD